MPPKRVIDFKNYSSQPVRPSKLDNGYKQTGFHLSVLADFTFPVRRLPPNEIQFDSYASHNASHMRVRDIDQIIE